MVGCGAKVLGPFKVGDNAKIAAGAVVLDAVEAGATAVGVPARSVKKTGAVPCQDLDQVHIPDPITAEIQRLEKRIKELEKQVGGTKDENL